MSDFAKNKDVPDKNVGDTIYRQAAVDDFYKHPNVRWTTLDVLDHINALPSAQPQRKKGKWIHKNDIYGVTYCSECDFELHIDNTSFCPNCGAEMVKGEDE